MARPNNLLHFNVGRGVKTACMEHFLHVYVKLVNTGFPAASSLVDDK